MVPAGRWGCLRVRYRLGDTGRTPTGGKNRAAKFVPLPSFFVCPYARAGDKFIHRTRTGSTNRYPQPLRVSPDRDLDDEVHARREGHGSRPSSPLGVVNVLLPRARMPPLWVPTNRSRRCPAPRATSYTGACRPRRDPVAAILGRQPLCNTDTLRVSVLLTASLLIGLPAWIGGDSTGSDANGTGGKMPLRLTDAPIDRATAVDAPPNASRSSRPIRTPTPVA
jgi:hypothetical protein